MVSIGRISSCFGLKGQLKVESSGDILNNLPIPILVFIGDKQKTPDCLQLKINSLKKNKNQFIISFENIDSIEKAENLKSKIIYLEKSSIPVLNEQDEFYIYQLIGLSPINEKIDLNSFKLIEVMDNPAHPILVFTDGTNEVLIPFINRFVKTIDLKKSTIEIPDWENWIED